MSECDARRARVCVPRIVRPRVGAAVSAICERRVGALVVCQKYCVTVPGTTSLSVCVGGRGRSCVVATDTHTDGTTITNI